MPMSFPLAATIIFVLLAVEYLVARVWERRYHTIRMQGDLTMMMRTGEELSVAGSSGSGARLVVESVSYDSKVGQTEIEAKQPFLSSLRAEVGSILKLA